MQKTIESTSSGPDAALARFAESLNTAWQECSPLVSVVVLLDLGDQLNEQVGVKARTMILNRTDSSPIRTLVSHLDLATNLTGTLVEALGQVARQILGQIAEGIDALNVIEQTQASSDRRPASLGDQK